MTWAYPRSRPAGQSVRPHIRTRSAAQTPSTTSRRFQRRGLSFTTSLRPVSAQHLDVPFPVVVADTQLPRTAADLAVLHERAHHVGFEIDLLRLATVRAGDGERRLEVLFLTHHAFTPCESCATARARQCPSR